MSDIENKKASGFPTFGFGALSVWLFIFAHVLDDVRHDRENLFLGFIVPFLFVATAIAVWFGKLVWYLFPALSPRRSQSPSTDISIFVGILTSVVLATVWGKSPLFINVYDSTKIMLLMVMAGILFGFIYKVGGRFSIFVSLFSACLAAIISFVAFLGMALLTGGEKNMWRDTWSMASIGVPYAIATVLYDCYRKALTPR